MSDDGVKIEDVVDQTQGPETPTPTPSFEPIGIVSTLFNSTTSFIESNGWFIFFGSILAYYAWTYLKKQWDEKYCAEGSAPLFSSSSSNNNKEYNEEKELERLEKIQLARERQQAALDSARDKYLADKRKKDEEKAQERILDWEKHEQGLGYRGKTKRQDDSDKLEQMGLSAKNSKKQSKTSRLRGSDYNPLTGESSGGGGGNGDGSCSWRPSRNNRSQQSG
jgi:hypothetical protein